MSIDAKDEIRQKTRPSEMTRDQAPKKILVVEDSEEVAHITALVLRDMGYKAIVAHDGLEASRLFVAEGPVDLLLSDVVLPGDQCGYELAEALRVRQPNLPVIFFTGYPKEMIAKESGYSESFRHLIKPAMISEIRKAVVIALEA